MKTLARDRDRAELLRRLRTVSPESTARWGRLSAHQMICHLTDSCLMALGRRPVSDATGFLQRTLVKWMALYVPLPWPPGIQTRPEIDQHCSGTRPADFAGDVAELERLLAVFAKNGPTARWPAHPIFGRMSPAQWLRWAYLHTDHHLRQFGS